MDRANEVSTHKGLTVFSPVNAVYYILFFLFYNFHFMRTTMFYNEYWCDYYDQFVYYYDIAYKVLMGLAVVSVLFVIDRFRYKLLAVALVAVSLLYNHYREVTAFPAILVFFLLLICSWGKSYKKIGIITLVCGTGWLIACYIGSKVGYISDIVYRNGGSHSFGTIYSTDLMCHILTLVMVYLILRKGKLKIWEYGFGFLILLFNMQYLQAKVGFGCLVLLMAGTFYYQFIAPRKDLRGLLTEKTFKAASLSFIIFAVLMIVLTLLYTPDPRLPVNSIRFLKTVKLRFIYGKQAFENYPITLWGTYIRERGNGGVQGGTISDSEYFFLDISYVRILMKDGVVVFTAIMTVFLVAQVRLFKQKQYYIMFILFIFALDCAIEHHMMEIAYSFFAYFAFCTPEPVVRAEEPAEARAVLPIAPGTVPGNIA